MAEIALTEYVNWSSVSNSNWIDWETIESSSAQNFNPGDYIIAGTINRLFQQTTNVTKTLMDTIYSDVSDKSQPCLNFKTNFDNYINNLASQIAPNTFTNSTSENVVTLNINNKSTQITLPTVTKAKTADKLTTARAIQLSGDASGSATFDGSSSVNINVSVSKSDALDLGSSAVGATDKPVYFTASGTPSPCTGPLLLDLAGNAASATLATRLRTSRTISLTGAVTGSTSFDGSKNVTINTTKTAQYLHRVTVLFADTSTINDNTLTYYVTMQFITSDNAPIADAQSLSSEIINVTGSSLPTSLPSSTSVAEIDQKFEELVTKTMPCFGYQIRGDGSLNLSSDIFMPFNRIASATAVGSGYFLFYVYNAGMSKSVGVRFTSAPNYTLEIYDDVTVF